MATEIDIYYLPILFEKSAFVPLFARLDFITTERRTESLRCILAAAIKRRAHAWTFAFATSPFSRAPHPWQTVRSAFPTWPLCRRHFALTERLSRGPDVLRPPVYTLTLNRRRRRGERQRAAAPLELMTSFFSLLWGGRGGMGCDVQHTLTRGISSLCTDTTGYQSASPLTLAAWLNISFLLLTLKWVEPRRQNIWIPLGESERRTSTGSFSCWQ